ncbi:CheR family methyltransferase [Paenibacillus wynnii]|uniref:CheR family methyltransferase n=1 Tax=Paenibacillus wynnii TaxID=268407 RepID=UPI002794BF85|nr:protein-glutamate O-methyltransferase CheR [Paenibacillus wynnii]MDQ0192454.1 chemotaxis protein methyltransferase CheR [Paenibacillus wynnii]
MISINNREFSRLTSYIQARLGIHLSDEKRSLVVGRLQNELTQLNVKSFSEYIDILLQDKTGNILNSLINKITTNHTYFMREVEHFTFLKETLLPQYLHSLKEKDLRLWCAACSTGEEPYTLAMLINDFFQNDSLAWDTQVLATDISDRVLELARKAEYSPEQILPLPQHWKSQYLRRNENGNFTFHEKIKNEVIFRKFNLMEPNYPFKRKFHIIFCRNVMIYFDMETKTELLCKLYDSLESGGYLFIGHSESINRESTPFKYIMPAVYRKE